MNRRGMVLVELLVYCGLTLMLMVIMIKTFQVFREAQFRVRDATSDLETAVRLLDDAKSDLRHARKIEVTPSGMNLTLEEGRKLTYAFDPADHTVRRTGTRYPETFEKVSFTREGGLVTIEVEMLRPAGGPGMRPRLEAVVYCRNLEE